MPILPTSVSSTHTYRGNSEINFFVEDQGALSVTIVTDRLYMRSVESKGLDYGSYAALFGHSEVIEKYGFMTTKSWEEIQTRINNVWVKRWQEKDPYSGLAVFKNDTNEFLGHIELNHYVRQGQAELYFLFLKDHWEKGYETEAVTAIVKEYAPATVQEGYLIKGKPLERIIATSRIDFPACCSLLEKIGMQVFNQDEKLGGLRRHYSLNLNETSKEV